MKRVRYFLIILGTVIVTSFVIVLIRRPEILQDFWLWIIGFAGIIAAPIKNLYDILQEKLGGHDPGGPQTKTSGNEANLKKRVALLEIDLKKEREFYMQEIKTLKEKISDLEVDSRETEWEDFFEEEKEGWEGQPTPVTGQLSKEGILTFIKSLTRKERRKLIRDGKLPGD